MKKPANKNKERGKDKYTATEVGTLIEEFRGEFKIFGEKLQANTERLDATYEQTGKNTEAIYSLKVIAEATAKDVAILKTDVAELKTDVAALKTDVATLKTDVAILKTDVATLKTDVAILKTDVAILKTDVATLKTDVAILKTDVAVLKTTVKDMASKIDRLVDSIEELIKIKVDRQDFQALELRVNALETKVASLAHN